MRGFKYYLSIILFLVILSVGHTGYAQSPWDRTDVNPHHDWTITFNSKVDLETIHQASIFVTQDLQNFLQVQLYVNPDQKSITVKAPLNGYEKGESYTLYISDLVKSENGTPLKEQISMEFTIKNDENTESNYEYEHAYEYEVFKPANIEREKTILTSQFI